MLIKFILWGIFASPVRTASAVAIAITAFVWSEPFLGIFRCAPYSYQIASYRIGNVTCVEYYWSTRSIVAYVPQRVDDEFNTIESRDHNWVANSMLKGDWKSSKADAIGAIATGWPMRCFVTGFARSSKDVFFDTGIVAGNQASPPEYSVVPYNVLAFPLSVNAIIYFLASYAMLQFSRSLYHLFPMVRHVPGTCAVCNYPQAVGNTCPECGTTY